jgi:hypothetical protein
MDCATSTTDVGVFLNFNGEMWRQLHLAEPWIVYDRGGRQGID